MSSPSTPTAPNYAQQYAQGVQTNLQYLPQFLSAEQDARNTYDPQRVQEQLDLQTQYGPQAQAAALAQYKQVDPLGVSIRDQLGHAVSSDLSLGTSQSPEMLREEQQAVRAGQSARGNILGNDAISSESLFQGQKGLDLYNRRIANAGTFLSQPSPEQQIGLSQITPDRTAAYTNPQAGNQAASFALSNYQNQLAQFQNTSNPWAGALGGAAGGATAGASFGPYGAAIGGVAGGVLGYFSDKRLKTGIKEIYKNRLGIGIKEFAYKDDPKQKYLGFLAQDVKKVAPDSVGELGGRLFVTTEFAPIPIT